MENLPVRNTSGLFLSTIPHAREDDKGRLARRLEDAEERAGNDEAGKVLAGGVAGERGAPGDDAEAEVLCYGDTGEDVVLGVLDDENGEVNTCCEPCKLFNTVSSLLGTMREG